MKVKREKKGSSHSTTFFFHIQKNKICLEMCTIPFILGFVIYNKLYGLYCRIINIQSQNSIETYLHERSSKCSVLIYYGSIWTMMRKNPPVLSRFYCTPMKKQALAAAGNFKINQDMT
nr:hypothetical protein Iba_chr08dCG2640 [Ipomoea batatas]